MKIKAKKLIKLPTGYLIVKGITDVPTSLLQFTDNRDYVKMLFAKGLLEEVKSKPKPKPKKVEVKDEDG